MLHINSKDTNSKVCTDPIRLTEKSIIVNRTIFIINMYSTESSLLINGSQVQNFKISTSCTNVENKV